MDYINANVHCLQRQVVWSDFGAKCILRLIRICLLYKVDEILLRGRIMRVLFKSVPTIMVRHIKISLEQQKVCTLMYDTKREECVSILNI